jgi:hypothetical protein
MSAFSFRQEFMASFEALVVNYLKKKYIKFSEEEPEEGQFYIAVDLAGFADVQLKLLLRQSDLTKRLLQWLKQVKKAGGLLISYMGVGVLKRLHERILKQSETTNQ